MVKHTQTIRWQQPTIFLSVFDHVVVFALKGAKIIQVVNPFIIGKFHPFMLENSQTSHKKLYFECRNIFKVIFDNHLSTLCRKEIE